MELRRGLLGWSLCLGMVASGCGASSSGTGSVEEGCRVEVSGTASYVLGGQMTSAEETYSAQTVTLWVQNDTGWKIASLSDETLPCGSRFVLLDREGDTAEGSGHAAVEGILAKPVTTLDLSHPRLQRPGGELTEIGSNTGITIHVSHLNTGVNFALTFEAPEVRAEIGLGGPGFIVSGGSTDYTYQDDYTYRGLPLVRTSEGDTAFVAEMDAVGNYYALTQVAWVAPLEMASGSANEMNAVLQPVTRDRGLSVGIQTAAFEAMASQLNPNAQKALYPQLYVRPFPSVRFGGPAWAQAEWGDGQTSSFAYANLLPDIPVELAGEMLYTTGASIHAAGAGFSFEEPATRVPAEITPQIGPVTHLKLNGQDAFVARDGVGLTPTLSWDPPALGTAAVYQVSFALVDSDRLSNAFDVYTSDTSLVVPEGELESGQRYVAIVSAYASNSRSGTAPLKKTLPEYRTDAITEPFSP